MIIIILSVEEIIELNKQIGGALINKDVLDFLISKIKSKPLDKEFKKQIAKLSTILWIDIIQNHPFLDGNKRTAAESVMLFFKRNNFMLKTNVAGKVYASLKIANNEIKYEQLLKWVYERLEEVKQ